MEIGEISLLSIVTAVAPMALFVLLALFAPLVYRRIAGKLIEKFRPHQPQWISIILDSYLRPTTILLRAVFIYAALWVLPLELNTPTYRSVLARIMQVTAICLIAWGAWMAAPVCRLLLRSAENKLDIATNRTMGRFFENIFRAVVGVVAGIAVLDALGIPVTGLLTGAGVAGIGITLAAQSTMSNLIAGVALVLEHPFGIGDYVILGSYEGTVEDISFRSTRIRTPDHAVITVENSKVCGEYIQNVTDRTNRLWQFTIGVTYDIPREKVETLCADLKELLSADAQISSDAMTVTLNEFSASSMDILVRCYVTAVDYTGYLQLKSRMNLAIMDLMKRDGCDFAFPSTSVYLEKMPPQVLVDTDRFLEMNRQRSLDDGFMHAVFNPSFNALATAMATARHRASKVLEIARDRHVEQALNETPEKLNRDRRLVLLSDPVTMARLHFRVWNSPERYSSWVSYYEGIKLNPLALRKPDAASQ